jgi:hypothetical protein
MTLGTYQIHSPPSQLYWRTINCGSGRTQYVLHARTLQPSAQGHPVPGGYKYRDLALQVGGVSDETVKYGREFCGTSTQE